MHGDTTELFADYLALSGANTRTNVDAEFPDQFHNCSSAANRSHRPVKRRQKAVASGVDFATSMPRKLVAHKGAMLGENVPPPSVTEFDKPLRRLDNGSRCEMKPGTHTRSNGTSPMT
jgi:hypothetical protein